MAFSEPDYTTYDGPGFSVEYPSSWIVENESLANDFHNDLRHIAVILYPTASSFPVLMGFDAGNFEDGKLDNISRHFLDTLELKFSEPDYANYINYDGTGIAIAIEPSSACPVGVSFFWQNFDDGKLDNISRHVLQTLEIKSFSTTENKPSAEINASLGTRENPLPIGYTLCSSDESGDVWEIEVLGVIPDATGLILNGNRFNDPPEKDSQFFLAKIRACYNGSGYDNFEGSYRLRAVGASSVAYSTFENSCGVIPDNLKLPDPEVFTGGCIEGYVGWEIKSSDVNSLVMYDKPFLVEIPNRIYLSLVP